MVHLESRDSEAGKQQSTMQAPWQYKIGSSCMNFLNNVACMHMMSEFRAHYVCTNLNNVRENMVEEVMKPGNPDLANLAFQWITIHYNGEKKYSYPADHCNH